MEEKPVLPTTQATSPVTPSPDSGIDPLIPSEPVNKSKNLPVIILSILLVLALGVASFFGYIYYQSSQPSTTDELSPSILEPSPTENDSTNLKTYENSEYGYIFQYPSDWQIISEIPENFLDVATFFDSDNADWITWYNSPEGQEKWLKSKMFIGKTCRGPILQNTADKRQIIAFDAIPNDAHIGISCWSVGYLYDENKWKVAEKYKYPIRNDNSGDLLTPEWKGDFLVFKLAGENEKTIVRVVLANIETFNLVGTDTLDQILSTFEFTSQFTQSWTVNKDAVLEVAEKFLNSYINKDCQTAFSLLSSSYQKEFQGVECNSTFTSFEILNEFQNTSEKEFYTQEEIVFAIKFYQENDSQGSPYTLRMTKENGKWKANLWIMNPY